MVRDLIKNLGRLKMKNIEISAIDRTNDSELRLKADEENASVKLSNGRIDLDMSVEMMPRLEHFPQIEMQEMVKTNLSLSQRSLHESYKKNMSAIDDMLKGATRKDLLGDMILVYIYNYSKTNVETLSLLTDKMEELSEKDTEIFRKILDVIDPMNP